jgi:hypothetical protein
MNDNERRLQVREKVQKGDSHVSESSPIAPDWSPSVDESNPTHLEMN